MKLKDVYGKQSGIKQTSRLTTVGLPMATVQKGIAQKKPLASKFLKNAGKKFRQKKVGRLPNDSRERYQAPVPPVMGAAVPK